MRSKRLYGMTDISKALGITPQAVDHWWSRRQGRLVDADFIGPRGTPFWSEESYNRIVEMNRPLVEKSKARGQKTA